MGERVKEGGGKESSWMWKKTTLVKSTNNFPKHIKDFPKLGER